jgi:hypothetical protein
MSYDVRRSYKCSSSGTLALIPGIGLKVSPVDRGDIESLTGFDLKVKIVVPSIPVAPIDSKKTGQTGIINSNDSWNSRNASMNLNLFVSKSASRQNVKNDVKRTNQESSIDVRIWK